jgi:glutathione-specific gamma-glutamylcyclotransferase
VTELEKAGVHDPHLWRMQELAADRLARLPERIATAEETALPGA